jgi:hypothetical protein
MPIAIYLCLFVMLRRCAMSGAPASARLCAANPARSGAIQSVDPESLLTIPCGPCAVLSPWTVLARNEQRHRVRSIVRSYSGA